MAFKISPCFLVVWFEVLCFAFVEVETSGEDKSVRTVEDLCRGEGLGTGVGESAGVFDECKT